MKRQLPRRRTSGSSVAVAARVAGRLHWLNWCVHGGAVAPSCCEGGAAPPVPCPSQYELVKLYDSVERSSVLASDEPKGNRSSGKQEQWEAGAESRGGGTQINQNRSTAPGAKHGTRSDGKQGAARPLTRPPRSRGIPGPPTSAPPRCHQMHSWRERSRDAAAGSPCLREARGGRGGGAWSGGGAAGAGNSGRKREN